MEVKIKKGKIMREEDPCRKEGRSIRLRNYWNVVGKKETWKEYTRVMTGSEEKEREKGEIGTKREGVYETEKGLEFSMSEDVEGRKKSND